MSTCVDWQGQSVLAAVAVGRLGSKAGRRSCDVVCESDEGPKHSPWGLDVEISE